MLITHYQRVIRRLTREKNLLSQKFDYNRKKFTCQKKSLYFWKWPGAHGTGERLLQLSCSLSNLAWASPRFDSAFLNVGLYEPRGPAVRLYGPPPFRFVSVHVQSIRLDLEDPDHMILGRGQLNLAQFPNLVRTWHKEPTLSYRNSEMK